VTKKNFFKTYKVLFVVLFVILIYMLLRISVRPGNGWEVLMNDFMAGFFLVFGALELYTYKSFQVVLKKYDPIAKRFEVYAQIYPFLFLLLGIILHMQKGAFVVSVVTIIILGIQTYGIIKVLRRGEKIECACVGTAFALPLSWVTVGENILMIFMALLMIINSL